MLYSISAKLVSQHFQTFNSLYLISTSVTTTMEPCCVKRKSSISHDHDDVLSRNNAGNGGLVDATKCQVYMGNV